MPDVRLRRRPADPVDATPAAFATPQPGQPIGPQDLFGLMVVNTSRFTIVGVRVNAGARIRLASPIRQTCTGTDPARCVANEFWAPLVMLPQGGTYDIELELADANGAHFRTRITGYQPSAQHRTGVVWLKD